MKKILKTLKAIKAETANAPALYINITGPVRSYIADYILPEIVRGAKYGRPAADIISNTITMFGNILLNRLSTDSKNEQLLEHITSDKVVNSKEAAVKILYKFTVNFVYMKGLNVEFAQVSLVNLWDKIPDVTETVAEPEPVAIEAPVEEPAPEPVVEEPAPAKRVLAKPPVVPADVTGMTVDQIVKAVLDPASPVTIWEVPVWKIKCLMAEELQMFGGELTQDQFNKKYGLTKNYMARFVKDMELQDIKPLRKVYRTTPLCGANL